MDRTRHLKTVRRIVIKIGTRVLSDAEGRLSPAVISSIVGQAAELLIKGKEVIIVSSGAIAAGRALLKMHDKAASIPEKQALAAIGQSHLINLYQQALETYEKRVAQVLLTRDDLGLEEQKKFLSYINKQSVDLSHIINDLLDISRIESGRGFALNKAFFNTSDTIAAILPYFQENYTNHQFEAVLHDKPVELYADKEKIEQIIKNLLSNAAKYSPDGIEKFERLNGELWNAVFQDRDTIVYEVIDNE